MPDTFDPTAWTAGLLGLFTLFAAIGALRQPGIWRTMIDEYDKSPALQLSTSLIELFLGAAIYIVNPWDAHDIVSCVMKAIGGLMMIEALVVVAFSDLYFHFWLKNLAAMHRVWAVMTLVLGGVLTVAGFARLA